MKYFSIQDWKTWEPWDQIQEKRKHYQDYIQSIRHKLPLDLQRLYDFSSEWNEQRIFLNDSQVSHITASFETQTVTFVFDGEYTDKDNKQIGRRRFFLNYQTVTLFQIKADTESAYQPGPNTDPQADASPSSASSGIDFDDHGWDEIELLEDGWFEHRMLFASGTEVTIQFRDFKLDYVDTPHDPASH